MKKKLLILLCAIMSTITASAFEVDGIRYNTLSKTTCEVTQSGVKYTGSISIPETVSYDGNTYTVTSIGLWAFLNCSSMKSIEIPNTVTSIGNSAFKGCSDLTSIVIPNSVTSIGTSVFSGCNWLTSIEISNSLIAISERAFENCSRLTSIEIPNSVTSIGDGAFSLCSNLKSIEIPNSVTSIGDGAFYGCSSLTSFKGDYASEDGRCLIIGGVLSFFAPSGLTLYTIPSTVTSIGNSAFKGCSDLTSIVIPNSVTSIGSSAFEQCSGLTSVEIPNSVTSIGNSAFSYCSSLTSVELPNSVTSIGHGAFNKCSNLTSIEIPNSITFIGSYTFQECSSLTSIEIPNSVTSIYDWAFCGCSNLTSIEIPNSVTSIGSYAFFNCSNLTSIVIPNSVTTISYYAFRKCSNLTSLTVDNEAPANISLGSDVFNSVPTSTCILYVPKGSKELYATADQWNAFTNIVEVFKGVVLTDGEAYEADEDESDVDVNYTRNFTNTEWQPLYVPFNMSYEEWAPYADVAEVHNVRGYDNNGDGEIDDIVIEFNKLSSGEIIPNVPYVIKAKNTGEVTFECTGKTLLAAPAEEGTVECSSTKMTYSFHGVYQPKTDMFSTGAYHLSNGAFHQTTSDATVLSPNRFYLMVTPKTGGYNPTSAPRMIRMMVNGDDTTTSIEGIEVDNQNDNIYYDLMGRRVVNPTQGIYIQNGRKVFVK